MNRLRGLGSLFRVGAAAARQQAVAPLSQEVQVPKALPSLLRQFTASSPARFATPTSSDTQVEELLKDYEHATGLEKYELEGKVKGVDVWEETWLAAPWGTEAAPVEVPSEYAERIVGVPDPDDDSIVWWGTIEDGQPPKQIIEGGEYFVLKRLPSSGGH